MAGLLSCHPNRVTSVTRQFSYSILRLSLPVYPITSWDVLQHDAAKAVPAILRARHVRRLHAGQSGVRDGLSSPSDSLCDPGKIAGIHLGPRPRQGRAYPLLRIRSQAVGQTSSKRRSNCCDHAVAITVGMLPKRKRPLSSSGTRCHRATSHAAALQACARPPRQHDGALGAWRSTCPMLGARTTFGSGRAARSPRCTTTSGPPHHRSGRCVRYSRSRRIGNVSALAQSARPRYAIG